jgi:hypothetical protein
MSESPLVPLAEIVSALGAAANDSQAFYQALREQASQPTNFDASVTQMSQLLSMANALAASSQLVLSKFPTPAGYIATVGLGLNLEALSVNSAQLTRAIASGNYNEIVVSTAAVTGAISGTAASVDGVLKLAGWTTRMFPWAVPLTAVATAIQLIWQNRGSFVWAGNQLLNEFDYALGQDTFSGHLARGVNEYFLLGRNVTVRRDPLVLDLDGDGLELSSAFGNTLFDHNADGIKTGTGWAQTTAFWCVTSTATAP